MSTSGIADRFRRAEIPVRAAALSYHSLLAIAPAFALVLWGLRLVGVTRQWRDLLRSYLVSHLNLGSSADVMAAFENLTTRIQYRTSNLIVLAVIVYVTTNFVLKLGDAIDRILLSSETLFDVGLSPPAPKRVHLLIRRSIVTIGLPFFLLLSVAATTWLRKESWLRMLFDLQSAGPWLAAPLPILVDILAVFLIYRFMPARPGRTRDALSSATAVGVVMAAFKYAMALYNRYALMTFKLYGAVSVIIVFVIWVNLMWVLILSGALFIRRTPTRAPTKY